MWDAQASEQRLHLCMATAVSVAAAAAASVPPHSCQHMAAGSPSRLECSGATASGGSSAFRCPGSDEHAHGRPAYLCHALPCSCFLRPDSKRQSIEAGYLPKQGPLLILSRSLMYCICRSSVVSLTAVTDISHCTHLMQLQRFTMPDAMFFTRISACSFSAQAGIAVAARASSKPAAGPS